MIRVIAIRKKKKRKNGFLEQHIHFFENPPSTRTAACDREKQKNGKMEKRSSSTLSGPQAFQPT